MIYNHLDELQIARVSIDGHYSTWCILLETFENSNGKTRIKYKDNYRYFYEEMLPLLRDRIFKTYNITNDDIDIYIEWINAKDAADHSKTNKNINIKDIKED